MPRVDNRDFYQAAINKFGPTPRGVHWNSRHSQQKRFSVICKLLPKNLHDQTLADAGCGFGDFYLYLQENALRPAHYIGLEIMEPMIEQAREQVDGEVLECNVLHDPLPPADFYVCSGAMNILTRFETHLFIRRCYEASRKGFVFNLLKGEDESLVYNYFTPAAIKTLGRELGAEIKIEQGYLPRDFTVAFYKRDAL